jgi:hypothetical protein
MTLAGRAPGASYNWQRRVIDKDPTDYRSKRTPARNVAAGQLIPNGRDWGGVCVCVCVGGEEWLASGAAHCAKGIRAANNVPQV